MEWRKPSPPHEAALRQHIHNTFGEELARQPFASLVNVAQPSESRILKAPLATSGGGWGQIAEGGWRNTDEPGYRKMRQLVEAAIAPRFPPGANDERQLAARTLWASLHGIISLAKSGKLHVVTSETGRDMARHLVVTYLAGLSRGREGGDNA